MIRSCTPNDTSAICRIINEAAQVYKGVIPEDCWHEPYMPLEALQIEIERGVRFVGYEKDDKLMGVMGFEEKDDVDLIRHAYVLRTAQQKGIGTTLLAHLESTTDRPILIGTWAAATWAIAFYKKNGYRQVSPEEKDVLLRTYWTITDRQIETSVVFAHPRWSWD